METGPRLKVSSDRLVKPGIEPATPGLQGKLFIHYTTAAPDNTGVVIDSKPHQGRTCKTSLLFAPLAVCVQAGYSAFPSYAPTKPLILLYFKYKTVLIP